MGYASGITQRRYRKQNIKLSDEQCASIYKEMQPYYFNRDITVPREMNIRIFNIERFLESKGAMKNGAIIIEGYQEVEDNKGNKTPDCDPIKYEEWMDKLDQVSWWRVRMQKYEPVDLPSVKKLAQSKKITYENEDMEF